MLKATSPHLQDQQRTRSEPESATSPGPAAPPDREFVVPITLVALMIRSLVALVVARTSSPQWLFNQATELGCLANSVLQGSGLSSPFCGHTGPSAFLAPGYPLFVAAVFRVFGAYTMHSATFILFSQALFGAATVPAAMWVARRAFNTRASNLAGVLCAFNPWLVGLEAVLWETTFSILLLTVLVGLAIATYQRPTRHEGYASALVLAIAMYVNPALVLTGAALLATALVLRPERRLASWSLPAVLFFLSCSVWPLRNLRTLHAFVPLRSNMGYELWQGNRPGADGFFEAKLHPNVNAADYDRYQALGELAYMGEKSKLAKRWIEANPRRFAELTLERVLYFWGGIERTRSALLILSTSLLSFAGWAALLALTRFHRNLAAIFAVPLLLLPVPYYVCHPDFRFWSLLAPTLTVLCAGWIALRLERPA